MICLCKQKCSLQAKTTAILRSMLQSNQRSLCGPHRSRNREGGGPDGQIISLKRTADGRRQRSREIIDEKRKKYRANNGPLPNTSTDSKETTLVILKSCARAPIRKEILRPTSKARREVSRKSLQKRVGC